LIVWSAGGLYFLTLDSSQALISISAKIRIVITDVWTFIRFLILGSDFITLVLCFDITVFQELYFASMFLKIPAN
jgi:hypothetical protein